MIKRQRLTRGQIRLLLHLEYLEGLARYRATEITAPNTEYCSASPALVRKGLAVSSGYGKLFATPAGLRRARGVLRARPLTGPL